MERLGRFSSLIHLCFLVVFTVAQEVKIEVLHKPETCDRQSKDGDMLSMHYTGTLQSDGSKFDSSLDRNQPFVFQLGQRQVIPGWEQGLQGMCVGEKRKLHIPYQLAYGDKGAGDKIPPNADLIFEVDLIKIDNAAPQPNIFKQIDTDEDNQLSRGEISEYLVSQIPPDTPQDQLPEGFDKDKMVEEIFQHEDKDRNGFISHDEFSGPKHDEL